MAKPKNSDLTKKTLNLRTGDFEKMGELFPKIGSSVAIRMLISKFVDKSHRPSIPPELGENEIEL